MPKPNIPRKCLRRFCAEMTNLKETKMTILLEQLKQNSQILNEYQMLKWLEANKVELNKLGIWMPNVETI
jgi:hypothetical protein